jgi:hypothetical protein
MIAVQLGQQGTVKCLLEGELKIFKRSEKF